VRKTFNISFPIADSEKGYLFKMTNSSNEAAVANFNFFLTVGEREVLYNNRGGLNLMKYLFEPMNDGLMNLIIEDITKIVQNNFNYIKIKKINGIVDDKNFFIGLNIELTIYGELFNETIMLI